MEARKQRNIKSGAQYDHLFPKANVDTHTIQKNAGVNDTVAFIPKVVNETLSHTKGIATVLKGRSDYETCRNIWQFVYDHIAYRKDKDGYEQIRSPARSWHDRRYGVDCDCYTTFISSILTNMGIRHKLRITKYSRDYFQHIYPVALLSGKEVIIDCVTDSFDYEVPYSDKKDYPMDLQYLNGLDEAEGYGDLDGSDGIAELGRLFKKKAGGAKKKKGGFFKKIGQGLKKVNLKKVLNVVNKFNPATVALRNGVLASMKINVGNVAKRLRWSYITEDQARGKKMDIGRWQKLVQTRQKLEKIFYGAGGKPENLKKAILHGKGNKDNGVHGFDGFGIVYTGYHHTHPMHPLNRVNKHTPLRQLLGDDMFFSENPVGTLGELGEPVSMAMITAASGVIAAIASTLKKIGDIFGGKGEGAKDFDEDTNQEAEKDIPSTATDTSSGGSAESKADAGDNTPAVTSKASSSGGGGGDNSSSSESSGGGNSNSGGGSNAETPSQDGESGTNGTKSKAVAKTTPEDSDSKDDAPREGFWDNNKKWIVPTGIGVAGLGILAFAAHVMAPAASATSKAMHGTPRKKAKPKAATKKKKAPQKKSVANKKIRAKALL